jgi:hypothetical protein
MKKISFAFFACARALATAGYVFARDALSFFLLIPACPAQVKKPLPDE